MRGMTMDYHHIWGVLPFPSFVLDADGRFLAMNDNCEVWLGTSRKQLSGQNIGLSFAPNSMMLDTISQCRREGISLTRHHVPLAPIGMSEVKSTLHIIPLEQVHDALLIVVILESISQQINQSLTNLSAGRSITSLAAMLAHEIRNPLAGIKGAAQLLSMDAQGEDLDLIEMIGEETTRIGNLVERVEMFGDQRPTEITRVNIHTVLDKAVRAAKAGFGADIQFRRDYDPSIPDAAGEVDQLGQVFQNLLKNASEAVEDRKFGQISIKTNYVSGVRRSIEGRRQVNLPLQIDIIDNGAGIPENLIDDIFDPFVTSKANGSGLGLSLVSRIISAHNGLVTCQSEDGRTVFSVRLPVFHERS